MKKMEWRWKVERIEEVKEFVYIGYTLQRNEGAQVRERVKKAIGVIGQIWRIGKRRFGKEWGKKLWMFDGLVWSVLGYGVEIWGGRKGKKWRGWKKNL